jgi:ubiquinol-cytochrome c reductase cytochrome b subunit
MPAWKISFLGHTLSLSVLIPFALPLTIVLGGAALWPSFERWATGDKSYHYVNDRPRNAPVRTAADMAAIVFYGVMWAEGANDVIADNLHVPLYAITWRARVLIIAGPVITFLITRRICIGLQRKDQEELLHGYESGIIRQQPNGEFIEVHKPLSEERRAVLEARKVNAPPPGSGDQDENGVPAPLSRGALGRIRARASRAFAETIVTGADGHGNSRRGGADGERVAAGRDGKARAAAGAASPAQLSRRAWRSDPRD